MDGGLHSCRKVRFKHCSEEDRGRWWCFNAALLDIVHGANVTWGRIPVVFAYEEVIPHSFPTEGVKSVCRNTPDAGDPRVTNVKVTEFTNYGPTFDKWNTKLLSRNFHAKLIIWKIAMRTNF